MACEEKEPVGNRVNETVGGVETVAFGGDEIPNFVEIRLGLRGANVAHQRGGGFSAARRARPRCFT